MSATAISTEDHCLFRVSGELNMHTVPRLWQEARDLFRHAEGDIIVDLADVTRSDSAGLALLVDWLRLTRQAGTTLHIQAMPEQMLATARVSGLLDVLPLNSD